MLYLDYDDHLKNCDSNDIGAYAIVLCSDDHIDIIRDAMGLIQLYIFRNGKYWAISNSFWKLCDEVSIHYPLNLDDWIYRWSVIIKGLERGHNNIYCELSGGYDSRITFALSDHAGIDFDDKKSVLYSYEPIGRAAKNQFKGDMGIAEQLADIKKKSVNRGEDSFENERISSLDGVQAYKDIYEGFMVQAFFPDREYARPVVRLGGHMGESVRAYRHDEKAITHRICIGGENERPLVKGYRSLVKSYKKICELTENPDADSDVNSRRLEIECYDDVFFGKQIICELLTNTVMISPFMDITLRRLDVGVDINPLLIYAVILQRICPEFLEVDLVGRRRFSGEIKKIAQLLCEKYPFENKPVEEKTIRILKKSGDIEYRPEDDSTALKLFKEYFKDENIRKEITDRLGDTGEYMYERAARSLEDEDRWANETYMMAVLAIVRMIEVEKRSRN